MKHPTHTEPPKIIEENRGYFWSLQNLLPSTLFNIIEKLHHSTSSSEIELIKNTKLYTHANQQQFQDVLNSIRLVKYTKGKLIFDINHPPETLYIIFKGSINIFSYNEQRLKTQLTMLSVGDYFSNRIISGHGKRTANINIETITDTILIRIETRSITPIQHDELGKIGSSNEIICSCMSVTRGELQELINQGIKNLDLLSRETGACTMCRSCEYKIQTMLGENPWKPATIVKSIKHNDSISSYFIKPKFSEFKKHVPGQHIIIQVNVLGKIIERAFTISDIPNKDGLLRITIKKDPKGLLSPWLFEKAPEQFDVNITQPQGAFTLNMDEKTPAICFAGGIGITPFVAYAKELAAIHCNKRLHIMYCALTENDFVLTDEFNEVTQTVLSTTISYWDTEKNGLITKEKILELVQSFHKPDIYICGPEGFEQFVTQVLQGLKVDQGKIFIERFVLDTPAV